jgi:hypothetical protein
MALVEIKLPVEAVERIVRAVESIADTLKRYCFPEQRPLPSQPKEDSVWEFNPEEVALQEEEEEARDILAERPRP